MRSPMIVPWKKLDSASGLIRQFTIASAVLILVLGGAAFQVLHYQSNQVENLNSSVGPAVDANNLVLVTMNEEYSHLLRYQVLAGNSVRSNFDQGRRRTNAALAALDEKLHILVGHTSERAIDTEHLELTQIDAVEKWHVFALSTEVGTTERDFSSILRASELFNKFRKTNNVLHNQIRREQERQLELTRNLTRTGQFVVFGFTLLGVVAMFFVGYLYTRSISRPISALRATMTRHREGDSSASAREDQGSAEIRSLAADFNALADANIKSRLRIENVNDRMTNLIDLSNVLGEKLNLNDLLTRIVESARQLIGARYVAIALLGADGKELSEFVTAGFSPEEVSAIGNVPNRLGLLGATFKDPKIIRLEHLADDPRSGGFPPHHPPMDSFLGVPIVIHGKVIGSFYLTESNNGSFSAEDERVAHSLSLLAAVAIKNVQRFEAEHERANTLERVNEIEHAIHAKSISERPFDVMCASLGKGLAVDRVLVRTVDGEGNMQLTSQWHRSGLQRVGHMPTEMFPYVGGLAEILWRSASIQITDDYLAPDVQVSERSRSYHQLTGARAVIFAPVGIGDRVIGIISVLMVDGPRHWTASDAEVLTQIAAYVAKTVVDDEHQEYLRKYIEQLEQLELQKTNFVATVSHELRTPLTSIIGYLELLRDGFAGTVTDEQKQMLEAMDRNSNRLQALIENLLVLNRNENGEPEKDIAGVSMGELITKICEEYFPFAESRGIILEIESGSESAIVDGEWGQLQSAFTNIVSNAIKFSHPNGVVTISCTVDEETRMVRIICQDRGIGIPIADQGNLFTRFFRASNATEQQIPGTGLGLTIVEQIIHDHGGQIQLTSVEGEGTTIVIDLPMAAVN